MAKKNIDYNSIGFKNKDIDKFTGKFGQGDPIKGERGGVGPYATAMLGAQHSGTHKNDDYKYSYVDKGTLSAQDSVKINANRPLTMNAYQMVSEGMKKGEKFPGLTDPFKKGLKTYEKLPAKYK